MGGRRFDPSQSYAGGAWITLKLIEFARFEKARLHKLGACVVRPDSSPAREDAR